MKLYIPVWQKILLELFNYHNDNVSINKSEITKKMDITYNHVVKVLAELNKLELLVMQKEGRTVFVALSEKGVKKALAAKELLESK